MKTIVVPKGTSNINQLHDELLVAFPALRGTKRADGSFENPLLRVESTNQEIRLTVPDDADEGAIQAVIQAHVPKVIVDPSALELAKDPTTLTLDERVKRLEVILGAS